MIEPKLSEVEPSRYNLRGVSADKEEVHRAIQNMDKGLFPSAFCKILPDIAGGDPEYCNIMHADTAGTKPSLAYIYWKETGDVSVFSGIVQDAMVMNLDDMACVGCVDNIVLSSTIGRNKHLIPAEVLEVLISSSTDFIDRMRAWGVHLFHAGGETADVGDIVRTLDVGFTFFARMKRSDLIVNDIRPGQVIVGVASDGQASYEDFYNGGMGSNGLTSARHDVFSGIYTLKYPESFDPAIPAEVVYSGTKRLSDEIQLDGHTITLGKLVLSPTRTYAPYIKRILETAREDIKGMIHCTGGGQTKVVKFLNQAKVIKDNLFPVPVLFQIIHEESGTAWREMYQVFNMGHRLELYTSADTAQFLIDTAQSMGLNARIIGRVEEAVSPSVELHTPYGQFSYGS
jgi:phosphoribosylformylglycinamidine cyclo-ligase